MVSWRSWATRGRGDTLGTHFYASIWWVGTLGTHFEAFRGHLLVHWASTGLLHPHVPFYLILSMDRLSFSLLHTWASRGGRFSYWGGWCIYLWLCISWHRSIWPRRSIIVFYIIIWHGLAHRSIPLSHTLAYRGGQGGLLSILGINWSEFDLALGLSHLFCIISWNSPMVLELSLCL